VAGENRLANVVDTELNEMRWWLPHMRRVYPCRKQRIGARPGLLRRLVPSSERLDLLDEARRGASSDVHDGLVHDRAGDGVVVGQNRRGVAHFCHDVDPRRATADGLALSKEVKKRRKTCVTVDLRDRRGCPEGSLWLAAYHLDRKRSMSSCLRYVPANPSTVPYRCRPHYSQAEPIAHCSGGGSTAANCGER
jgi:hypothetical protein